MRWNLLVAGALLALSLVAAAFVACSDASTCKPGTLNLEIALLDTAPLADTITVTSTDPGAPLSTSFPHAPNPSAPGVEHVSVEVSWPGGYPANTVVHLIIRALGGVTVLGASAATIHLDDKCSVGSALVRGAVPMDLGGTD